MICRFDYDAAATVGRDEILIVALVVMVTHGAVCPHQQNRAELLM